MSDPNILYFRQLTDEQQRLAIQNLALQGMSDHGIAVATQISVEQVRRILGTRPNCEGCE